MSGLKSQVTRAKKKHAKPSKFVPKSLLEYRPDLVPEILKSDIPAPPKFKPTYFGQKATTSYDRVVLRLLREKQAHTLRWAAGNPRARAIAKKHGIKLPAPKKKVSPK